MDHCVICGGATEIAFAATALKKYEFEAMTCPQCGFLQVKNPHWLEESYSDAISATDTGLVARNLSLAAQLNPLSFTCLVQMKDTLILQAVQGFSRD